MNITSDTEQVKPTTTVVGNAVGVPEPLATSTSASAGQTQECAKECAQQRWFVAIVQHNTEKAVAQRLQKLGHTPYVAIQKEYKVWKNGRKAQIDRVVIPTVIFIRCTESERRSIVNLPFINRFMTNRAGTTTDPTLHKPLAVIPDREIDQLRFMLGNSETPVTITNRYRKGDRVRVVRGPLRTLEGEVITTPDGKSELIVYLTCFGGAKVSIDTADLQPA